MDTDNNLRQFALQKAVEHTYETEPPEKVLERAEAYYSFLRGPVESTENTEHKKVPEDSHLPRQFVNGWNQGLMFAEQRLSQHLGSLVDTYMSEGPEAAWKLVRDMRVEETIR